MGLEHTIQHLEELITASENAGCLKFARRKIDIESLGVWLNYFMTQKSSKREPKFLPLAPEANVRMIRSSPILSFISRDYQTMITPILYEKKEDGSTSKGKLHGGDFEYMTEDEFKLLMDMRREIGQELPGGKFQMIKESITPQGVRLAPEGRVLQFFHARLDKYPTIKELGNPQKEHESFKAKYYTMEDITRMVWDGKEDIRPETMEMIWLKYLWRKSRLVQEGDTRIAERRTILEKAGLDMDPEKVLTQYRVYYTTPYITTPSIPKTKIYVSVGPFLWEKEMPARTKGTKGAKDYSEQERRYAEQYFRKHRGKILTELLLQNHLLSSK